MLLNRREKESQPCLLQNVPDNGAAAPSNREEDPPSIRHVAVLAWKWPGPWLQTQNQPRAASARGEILLLSAGRHMQPLCPH